VHLKQHLKRIPELVPAYRHAWFLAQIVRDSFTNPKQVIDGALARGEWDYSVPEHQHRYGQVLEGVSKLRGSGDWGDVLEIGCAEGIFTEELALRARTVTVGDISAVAYARAAKRCAPYSHVRFLELDILKDAVPGQYDLAFVMGVLEMYHGATRLGRAIKNLARALRPGGLLVLNDPFLPFGLERSWWARFLAEGGRNHVAFIEGREGLHLVYYQEIDQPQGWPGYMVALFEKSADQRQ